MKKCANHPDVNALSTCCSCGDNFCAECLDEGRENYYCRTPECNSILMRELDIENLPAEIICPNCSTTLHLSDRERVTGKIHCAECEALIDITSEPVKVLLKSNYVELLSSFNQGDIAVISSILDDADIDYSLFGVNFLSVDALIQPARFYVNETQLSEAKELLRDFELRIWGTSTNQ